MSFVALGSRCVVRRKVSWFTFLLGLLMVGWGGSAQAFFLGAELGYYVPTSYFKYGAVYTRSIVPGPNGKPIYVEYNSGGDEAREIGEAIGQYERAFVMSADIYRSYLQRQSAIRERYPTSVVMSAAAYRGKTFLTTSGDAINKPSIASTTLTVVVRADNELFTSDGKELLLLELPIQSGTVPALGSKALLMSPEGAILTQTANSIGFRVGFYGKNSKPTPDAYRDRDADIYGPVPGVTLTLPYERRGNTTVTDSSGKYHMQYSLPPCPGITIDYPSPLLLELKYKRFNPRLDGMTSYYMVRDDEDYCTGIGVYSKAVADALATASSTIKPVKDFPIDLMVLGGSANLEGAKVAAVTTYNAETSDKSKFIQSQYDYDGDGIADFVVPGKKSVKLVNNINAEVFVTTPVAQAELQGIYLSTRYPSIPSNTEQTAPDFTRVIDTTPDFKDRGLLKTISKEDLKNTDIYVFRESNGQLIAERRGLHESELYQSYSEVDDSSSSFRYIIQLRGSVEGLYGYSPTQGDSVFQKWQSAGGFKEEFQKRNANHLKAGEQVRIIAINRPTGYMGSARVQLQSALSGNIFTPNNQQIEMAPPNLRIWAERRSKVEQGATKGEERKQLIGNEGAALGSDVVVNIFSDWRDQDGSPLPEELADYGYTGRLARVVAANTLSPVGVNNLAQFQIKPGSQVQVIQLPEQVLAKQHLYVQVAGQPSNRNPDFKSGSGTGVLKYRPDRFVPIMVPIHDESATELSRQAYKLAVDENPTQNFKRPGPLNNWLYRSELQFSLYDLTVTAVRKTEAGDHIEDLLAENLDSIKNTDKLIEIFYDLVKSEFSNLDYWSRPSQDDFVLSIGAKEVKVSVGANKSLKFDGLSHLALLGSDDFTAIRLSQNSDMGNVLWELAFPITGVRVFYSLPQPKIEVPADSTASLPSDGNGTTSKPLAFRTLGGVRLRLDYSPAPGETMEGEWSWDLPADNDVQGCFQDFKTLDDQDKNILPKPCNRDIDQQSSDQKISLYWQPDWSNSNDILTTLSVNIRGKDGVLEARKIKVRFARRALSVAADEMKGSDVEMLYKVMWDIGMSPTIDTFERNSSGNLVRKKHPGVSGSALLPDRQRVYGSQENDSVAMMVGRFNYTNYKSVGSNTSRLTTAEFPISGGAAVPVVKIGRHWRHYLDSYYRWMQKSTVMFSDLGPDDIAAAVNVFDGLPIRYSATKEFPAKEATYTEGVHTLVENLVGVQFDRSKILKAMANREVSETQMRGMRIIVGGADERGSKGFNQEYNAFTYGGDAFGSPEPGNKGDVAIAAYDTEGRSSVNHYDPRQNLIAKAVHLSDRYGGTFTDAFLRTTSVYQAPTGLALVQYKNGEVVTSVSGGHRDDAYEKLAKGLGGYNQGIGHIKNRTWVQLLTSSERNTPKALLVSYAISVMHDSNKLNLPYRTYTFKVSSPDGDFCFSYGENGWGKETADGQAERTFARVALNAQSYADGEHPANQPDPRVACP